MIDLGYFAATTSKDSILTYIRISPIQPTAFRGGALCRAPATPFNLELQQLFGSMCQPDEALALYRRRRSLDSNNPPQLAVRPPPAPRIMHRWQPQRQQLFKLQHVRMSIHLLFFFLLFSGCPSSFPCTTCLPSLLQTVSGQPSSSDNEPQSNRHTASAATRRTLSAVPNSRPDLLQESFSSRDVAHLDVMAYINLELQAAKERGLTLSNTCEHRFGWSYIEDQRQRHFQMCTPELSPRGRVRVNYDKGLSLLRLQEKERGRKAKLAAKVKVKAAVANGVGSVGAARVLLDSGKEGSGPPLHVRTGEGEGLDAPHRQQSAVQEGQHVSGAATKDDMQADRSAGSLASNAAVDSLRTEAGRKYGSSQRASQHDSHDGNNSRHHQHAVHTGISSSRSRTLTAAGLAVMPATVSAIASGAALPDGGEVAESDDLGSGTSLASNADFPMPGSKASTVSAVGKDAVAAGKAANATLGDTNMQHVTSVDCYWQPNTGSTSKDAQTFCVARNVLLDSCALYDGVNEGFDVRFPAPKPGAIKAACRMNGQVLSNRTLTRGFKNKLWWRDAAKDQQYAEVQAACDASSANVIHHPVVFIVRDRYTHPMHELEIFAALFTSLAVAQLPEVKEMGLQVVIADQMPFAGYRPTYAAISHPYRLRHLAEDPYPKGTCFKLALFVHAFSNGLPFNPNFNITECYSPIMVAVHKWMRHLHRELDPDALKRSNMAHAETGGVVRRNVVWMSRRNLEAMRTLSGAMSVWQTKRVIPNDGELVIDMQRAINAWNSRSCLLMRAANVTRQLVADLLGADAAAAAAGTGAAVGMADASDVAKCRNSGVQFDFVFGEFSDVPFYPDQLMTLFRSGVIIGVHGAGLTFVVHAPPHTSAVIELVADGWEEQQTGGALHTIPSVTWNMGSHYQRLKYTWPHVDPKELAASLTRSMDEVNDRILKAKDFESTKWSLSDQFSFDVVRPQSCPGAKSKGAGHFVREQRKAEAGV